MANSGASSKLVMSESPAVKILQMSVADTCRDTRYNQCRCTPGFCCQYGDIAVAYGVDTYTQSCCCMFWAWSCYLCCLNTKIRTKLGLEDQDCCVVWCNHLWCCSCLANLEYDAAMAHKAWTRGETPLMQR